MHFTPNPYPQFQSPTSIHFDPHPNHIPHPLLPMILNALSKRYAHLLSLLHLLQFFLLTHLVGNNLIIPSTFPTWALWTSIYLSHLSIFISHPIASSRKLNNFAFAITNIPNTNPGATFSSLTHNEYQFSIDLLNAVQLHIAKYVPFHQTPHPTHVSPAIISSVIQWTRLFTIRYHDGCHISPQRPFM